MGQKNTKVHPGKVTCEIGVSTDDAIYLNYLQEKYGLAMKKKKKKKKKKIKIAPVDVGEIFDSPIEVNSPQLTGMDFPTNSPRWRDRKLTKKLLSQHDLLSPKRKKKKGNVFQQLQKKHEDEKKRNDEEEEEDKKQMTFSKATKGKSAGGNKMINDYIITKSLGEGAYGKVHLGEHQTTGELFAIKTIDKAKLERLTRKIGGNKMRRPPRGKGRKPGAPVKKQLKPKFEEEKDFLIEIAILKKLNHPNIVKLFEVIFNRVKQKYYLVYEFVKNGAAMENEGFKSDRTPFTEEKCQKYFRDLLRGLEYLHKMGITHRDIKPENLLLDENDVLKITDFGVSAISRDGTDLVKANIGTELFKPPEALSAKSGAYVHGHPFDVWSTGVTLFMLYFGILPFTPPKGMPFFMAYSVIRTKPPSFPCDGGMDPEELTGHVCTTPPSDSFRDVLMRMMDKDPVTRITIEGLKVHPWVTKNGTEPFINVEFEVSELKVNASDLENAVAKSDSKISMSDKFVILHKIQFRMRDHIETARQSIKRRNKSSSSMSSSDDNMSSGEDVVHIQEYEGEDDGNRIIENTGDMHNFRDFGDLFDDEPLGVEMVVKMKMLGDGKENEEIVVEELEAGEEGDHLDQLLRTVSFSGRASPGTL